MAHHQLQLKLLLDHLLIINIQLKCSFEVFSTLILKLYKNGEKQSFELIIYVYYIIIRARTIVIKLIT